MFMHTLHLFVCVCVRSSDLDWSWFEPELLVTSSVDTYIYIWDTRWVETCSCSELSHVITHRRPTPVFLDDGCYSM